MIKKTPLEKLFDLKNQNIILTGSSGILGTHFSHFLSSLGANVILIDINETKNKNLEKTLLKKYQTKPLAIPCDISVKPQVINLKKLILKKYNKIDALINNAAFHPKTKNFNISKPLSSFPLDLWNDAIGVNLTGLFLLCQQIGGIMEKQKNGKIVNISSIYGMVGPDQRIYGKSKLNSPISYAATKGAMVNLTRYLAAYWQRKNITVNTLSLGGVQNEKYMNPDFIKKYSEKTILGRMANQNEYNGALLFLLSKASSYMTGSNLVIDGGWTAW
jgi:NAD(P)-dependent dehydrogenase (short-subunit alcohol dehydrogenase family)